MGWTERRERKRQERLQRLRMKAAEARTITVNAIAFGTVSDAQQALRYEAQCWDKVGHAEGAQALFAVDIKNSLLIAAEEVGRRSSPRLDESSADIPLSYEWAYADAIAKMKRDMRAWESA
jgi:hypothetical protein